MLDDGEGQDHLDESVHQLAEDQEAVDHHGRAVAQAGGEQEAEDEQRRQQFQRTDEVEGQQMRGLRTGRDDVAHRQVEQGDHHQRRQHREGDADQAGHGTEGQVLVILALEHHQPDRDQVHDGRPGGVADDHRGDPHVTVSRQRIGQLITAHVHGDDGQGRDRHVRTHGREVRAEHQRNQLRQIGDRNHDPCLCEKHRPDGVDAVDEFLPQPALWLNHRSESPHHCADHYQVDNEVSELCHHIHPSLLT